MEEIVIQVDGSELEGGGQILRNATAIAAICGLSVNICNIRAKRPNPGLAAQHCAGLGAIRDLFDAKLENCEIGSREITFTSNSEKISSYTGRLDVKVNGAGSVALILQAVLPCLVFGRGPMELSLKGGTNASKAPQVDYLDLVLFPMLKKLFGVEISIQVKKRGFFPKGGGEVLIKLENPLIKLNAFELMDRGDSVEINGIALAAGKLYSTAACDEMKKRAESSLKKAFPNISINIRSVYESNSASSGTSMVLALKTSSGCILGGDAIGDHKGVQTPIDVANDAVKELKRAWDLNACVDEWLQDQLIVFMALAEGRSQMNSGPLSLHTQTAIYCAEKLTTSRFTVTSKEEEKDSGASEMISCQGIGHFNHNLS